MKVAIPIDNRQLRAQYRPYLELTRAQSGHDEAAVLSSCGGGYITRRLPNSATSDKFRSVIQ